MKRFLVLVVISICVVFAEDLDIRHIRQNLAVLDIVLTLYRSGNKPLSAIVILCLDADKRREKLEETINKLTPKALNRIEALTNYKLKSTVEAAKSIFEEFEALIKEKVFVDVFKACGVLWGASLGRLISERTHESGSSVGAFVEVAISVLSDNPKLSSKLGKLENFVKNISDDKSYSKDESRLVYFEAVQLVANLLNEEDFADYFSGSEFNCFNVIATIKLSLEKIENEECDPNTLLYTLILQDQLPLFLKQKLAENMEQLQKREKEFAKDEFCKEIIEWASSGAMKEQIKRTAESFKSQIENLNKKSKK